MCVYTHIAQSWNGYVVLVVSIGRVQIVTELIVFSVICRVEALCHGTHCNSSQCHCEQLFLDML